MSAGAEASSGATWYDVRESEVEAPAHSTLPSTTLAILRLLGHKGQIKSQGERYEG